MHTNQSAEQINLDSGSSIVKINYLQYIDHTITGLRYFKGGRGSTLQEGKFYETFSLALIAREVCKCKIFWKISYKIRKSS